MGTSPARPVELVELVGAFRQPRPPCGQGGTRPHLSAFKPGYRTFPRLV